MSDGLPIRPTVGFHPPLAQSVPARRLSAVAILVTAALFVIVPRASWAIDDVQADTKSAARSAGTDGRPARSSEGNPASETIRREQPLDQSGSVISAASFPPLNRPELLRTLQTVALFGLISIAPVGLLMVTAFVRINMVLILLRQALGSPQVPGNQVLTGLACCSLRLSCIRSAKKSIAMPLFLILPDSSLLQKRGRLDPNRSRYSWLTRSCGPNIKTTCGRFTSMRSRPARTPARQAQHVPRTFRSVSWRPPIS